MLSDDQHARHSGTDGAALRERLSVRLVPDAGRLSRESVSVPSVRSLRVRLTLASITARRAGASAGEFSTVEQIREVPRIGECNQRLQISRSAVVGD